MKKERIKSRSEKMKREKQSNPWKRLLLYEGIGLIVLLIIFYLPLSISLIATEIINELGNFGLTVMWAITLVVMPILLYLVPMFILLHRSLKERQKKWSKYFLRMFFPYLIISVLTYILYRVSLTWLSFTDQSALAGDIATGIILLGPLLYFIPIYILSIFIYNLIYLTIIYFIEKKNA